MVTVREDTKPFFPDPPDFGSVSFEPDINVKDDSNDTPSDPLRVRGWHDYVHPTMRELTKNLRAKNYPVLMNKGLEQAGIKLKDIPQLKCHDCANPPRKGLCFKFILGNCNGGEVATSVTSRGSSSLRRISIK